VALNWSTVKPEHVKRACELLLKGEQQPRITAKGIFVVYESQQLPAKHVVRLAYCFANNLSPSTALKFSSGEGIANLLRRLGFAVERVASFKSSSAG
jgi:hypothetical protein